MHGQGTSPSIGVLRRGNGNAPIAPADGAHALCGYCGARTEIPESHRTLRDSERELAARLGEADAVLGSLGAPPCRLARWWGSASTAAIWVLLWPLAFVAASALFCL